MRNSSRRAFQAITSLICFRDRRPHSAPGRRQGSCVFEGVRGLTTIRNAVAAIMKDSLSRSRCPPAAHGRSERAGPSEPGYFLETSGFKKRPGASGSREPCRLVQLRLAGQRTPPERHAERAGTAAPRDRFDLSGAAWCDRWVHRADDRTGADVDAWLAVEGPDDRSDVDLRSRRMCARRDASSRAGEGWTRIPIPQSAIDADQNSCPRGPFRHAAKEPGSPDARR
jgi:hypothetical protein